MSDKKVTGACLCGAVRYEADEVQHDAGMCHCESCKRSTGGLFAAVVGFDPAKFRFVSEEPIWYQSSKHVRRGFCGKCGSPIAYRRDDRELMVITIGTLDEPENTKPVAHYFTDDKVPWVDIQSHLPDETKGLQAHKVNMVEDQ